MYIPSSYRNPAVIYENAQLMYFYAETDSCSIFGLCEKTTQQLCQGVLMQHNSSHHIITVEYAHTGIWNRVGLSNVYTARYTEK